MKKNQIVILSGVVFLVVIFWGLRTLTPEDEWICENGSWVAHGKPSAEKPVFDCVKDNNLEKKVSCQTSADCLCGLQKAKGTCEFGSRFLIEDSRSCDSFCEKLEGVPAGCIKGECQVLK